MQTTGIFTTHIVQIPWKFGKTFNLIPFGDIHYGAPLHCKGEWKRFCDQNRNRKDCAYLGLGDYTDLVSTSERGRIRMGKDGLHESTMQCIEDIYQSTSEEFLKTIDFMQGKCIGLIEGNHYGNFGDGTTTTMRMSQKLRTQYLGVISLVRLSFTFGGTCMVNVDVLAHHGKGGGQLPGSAFNTVGKMADIAEADIYLMGHDHNRGCVTGQRISPYYDNKNKKLIMKERKIIYGRTGSFLKGYVPGKASYIADLALKPANLGWIEIAITPYRVREDGGQRIKVDLRGVA